MSCEVNIMFYGIPYAYWWLILAVIFGLIEIVTFNMVTVWFAVGAVLAMLSAMFGIDLLYQFIIFIIASGALLYFTKQIVKNLLKCKTVHTNADSLVGDKGRVIEKINNSLGTGQVKIRGQVWTARSTDNENIDVDETVRVEYISGVKLIVNRATNIN